MGQPVDVVYMLLDDWLYVYPSLVVHPWSGGVLLLLRRFFGGELGNVR